MIKSKLKTLVAEAAGRAHARGVLPSPQMPPVSIEEPKADAHGDLATGYVRIGLQPATSGTFPEQRSGGLSACNVRDPTRRERSWRARTYLHTDLLDEVRVAQAADGTTCSEPYVTLSHGNGCRCIKYK